MGDYFSHWLNIGRRYRERMQLPRIYYVNWFRKDKNGKYLWPGFGDNSRILKWIFERTSEVQNAIETPIGYLPSDGALDLSGLNISSEELKELFSVDKKQWEHEIEEIRNYFRLFGQKLPVVFHEELRRLEQRLQT